MKDATHVVFWDIDGTLLTTARAGVAALEVAAEQITGRPAHLRDLHTSGLTDHEVAAAALRHVGADDSTETCARFLAIYEDALPGALEGGNGRALEGVVETLTHLRDDPRVLSMLLTGNTAAGARAKLTRYGLVGLCDEGVFCTPGDDRVTIARRAVEIAVQRLGREPDPDNTYVVGDTPSDVACGKAIGARTIAVATGGYSLAELRAAGPWRALERIPQIAELEDLLGLA